MTDLSMLKYLIMQSFILIALRLVRPAMVVATLFAFLVGWGEYVLASVLIPSPDAWKTKMGAMYKIANDGSTPGGQFAAGAVFIIIPVLLVFLWLHRYLEGDLTLSGEKV
jgi:ABC-type maltose transport system permease subunit